MLIHSFCIHSLFASGSFHAMRMQKFGKKLENTFIHYKYTRRLKKQKHSAVSYMVSLANIKCIGDLSSFGTKVVDMKKQSIYLYILSQPRKEDIRIGIKLMKRTRGSNSKPPCLKVIVSRFGFIS